MSRQFEPTFVYVIRQVSTGKLIKFDSKCGWATIGAAKGAFALHMHHHFKLAYLDSAKGLYDNQEEFKIEELR